MPGFVPVNFKTVGKILLALSAVCLCLKGADYLLQWAIIPTSFLLIGLGGLLISAYLLLFGTKPEL